MAFIAECEPADLGTTFSEVVLQHGRRELTSATFLQLDGAPRVFENNAVDTTVEKYPMTTVAKNSPSTQSQQMNKLQSIYLLF